MWDRAPIQPSQNETECHFISRCGSRHRSEGSRVGGERLQAAQQLRHNLPRTYNQTIAIIINRYTFNDRVCRAQTARCNFNVVGARDCSVYVIAAFVWKSLRVRRWMCRFGVGISGKTAPGARGAGDGGPEGGEFLRSELADSMICSAVNVHLADCRDTGHNSCEQRQMLWQLIWKRRTAWHRAHTRGWPDATCMWYWGYSTDNATRAANAPHTSPETRKRCDT